MGKILLLGGTGALGSYLADELLKTDHSVFITSRSEHQDFQNIHYLRGNAKDDAFLDSLLKDSYDCIVDFMIWPTVQFKEKYREIITKTGHYVYISSYRAYANADMTPLTEDSPLLLDVTNDKEYLKTDEYALAKGREERVLKDSPYSNYTIVRPAITFSTTRFQLGTLEASSIIPRTVKGLPLLLPRDMMDKRAAISWAGDVGRMMAFLLGNDRAKKEIFNVATSESHTWSVIAGYYHDLIGTNFVLTDLDTYIKVVFGQYQVRYDRMFNRIVDNSKILNLMQLSDTDLTPIREGLTKELADLHEVYSRIKEDTKLCARMDEQLRLHHSPTKLYYPVSTVQSPAKPVSPAKPASPAKPKGKVGILNFHFSNNYGAVLVPFALKRTIESMGYSVEIINYIPQKFSGQPAFLKFRGKYLAPISKEFTTKEELEGSASDWERVVVGSDQVWRMFQTDVYMLGWASGKCSLISYAASFGHNVYSGSLFKSDACTLLHRFDAISVRENSGVVICRDDFGVDAVQVLDPTFLLSAETYMRIIDTEKNRIPEEDYVCGIFLNAQSATYINNPNVLLDIRSKYKLISPIKDENRQFRPVAEWLALIKNAKYVITDSFHGVVFSIIFNKQFVTLMHEDFNGNSRIPSLLESLGIGLDHIVTSINAITVNSFHNKIDYDAVNSRLTAERHRSWLFLKEALEQKPSIKDPVVPVDSYEAFKNLELSQMEGGDTAKSHFYKKWIELRLAENAAVPGKVEELERRVESIEKTRSSSITNFCIYWTYRMLFRISTGKLKAKFKQKRAYYRKIVKG